MHYQYGDKMLLRILDEVEFWKRQETEHTVVIRMIAPDLEEKFVELLKQWEKSFDEMEALAIRYTETLVRYGDRIPDSLSQTVTNLVEHSLQQSQQFMNLLMLLKTESHALKNPSVFVVIDHIRRESEYFIGVAQIILYADKSDLKETRMPT